MGDECWITAWFIVMKEFILLSVDDIGKDPYRRFLELNTRLCYNTFQEGVQVVQLCNVVANFAVLTYTPVDIGKECIVVRNLDKVRGLCASITHYV